MSAYYDGPPRMEIHRKSDGLLLLNGASARYLNWWESLLYRLFGRMPKP